MFDNCSYYGSYRTRTYSEIFPDFDTFKVEYLSSQIPNLLASEQTIQTIYYLLYARYANSHIASSDENRFRYALFSKIFMYAPSWEKRLDIQAKVRALSESDIITGGKAIYNTSLNPGGSPSSNSLEELPTINQQNTTNYKKSKLEAYAILNQLIETDVTESFLIKFKKLFIQVLAPDNNLWYETVDENRPLEGE